MQWPLSNGVHIGGDTSGHAPQELLGLGHRFLLPLPLLHQRRDDHLFLLLAQVNHPAANIILHAADLHVPRVGGMISVDGLGDGRGREEHPVQVVAILAQGLTHDEAFGDTFFLGFVVPLQVYVHIDALAGPVVHRAEQAGVPGDPPAIFPPAAHLKILVWQIAHALQPVLQLLEHLLSGALAHILQPPGIIQGGLPAVKFNYIHFSNFLRI